MKRFESACFVTGAHIDLAGRLEYAPILHVSNPGRVERLPGGAGLNAASTAAALGLTSSIAGPVGEDEEAGELKRLAAMRGIGDALHPMEGRRTGSYTAIMAPDGEMVIGLADLSIHEAADADWLMAHCGSTLQASDLWFISTNLTAETLEELCSRAGGRAIAAATISPAKAVRLKSVLSKLDLVFTNLNEARVITGLAQADGPELAAALTASGVKAGTISVAGGPLTWWDGGAMGRLVPPPVDRIADVNGAGDALAGATLAALARGLPMEDAARIGIAAAQLTLSVREPVYTGLDWALVEARTTAIAPLADHR
jgi:pseudouridine kinase